MQLGRESKASSRRTNKNYPPLRVWLLAFVALGVPGVGLQGYITHVAFGIPLVALLTPFFLMLILTLFLVFSLYFSVKHQVLSEGDSRWLIATLGAYGLAGCWLYTYYGTKFGLIDAEDASESYLLFAVFVPFTTVLGYYFHRKFFSRQGKEKGKIE